MLFNKTFKMGNKMTIVINNVSIPKDLITYIGGFLEGADLINFSQVCKVAKEALEKLSNYEITKGLHDFTEVYAEYFQNVPNFFDSQYPHYQWLLDVPRDDNGFLPDFESDLFVRRNGLGKNSVKFFLKEAGELYKDQPQNLYQTYQIAHQTIKLLKTPLSTSKKLQISFIKIDQGIDKAKQSINDFLGESFKQILMIADRTNTFIHENYRQVVVVAEVMAIVGQVLYQNIG